MNSPKNFFLQIGIIATLYASIVSFLTFVFGLIDHVFPNILDYYNSTNEGVRYSISILIVMFPLFLWLSRIHRKTIIASPEIKDSKLRKWLIYLTLFLAGLTVAIDVIVLINAFLGGEALVVSFILKVAVVLVVALTVFYFYLKDIKGFWDENPKKVKAVSIGTGLVVLVSVVAGIILIGSPSKQRDVALDMQRVNDLQSIQYQVLEFYQDKGMLPKTLVEVVDPIRGNVLAKDPESKEDYKYEVVSALSFKICATFKTSSKETSRIESKDYYPAYSMLEGTEYFEHEIGENCFNRTIDPDRYPIRKK